MGSNTTRKKCRRCPCTYPATADYFRRDKREIGGFASLCKHCMQHDYQRYKVRAAAYETSLAGKQRRVRYYKKRQDQILTYGKQYHTVNKPRYWSLAQKWRAEHRDYYRLTQAARQAVYQAVKTGILLRPNACPTCGRSGKVQAHHHQGYEQQYWLAIVWLCQTCHRKAELTMETHGALP